MRLLSLLIALYGFSYLSTVEPLMAQEAPRPGLHSSAPSPELKLLQKVSFIPESKPALKQLVEVAQHYQLPMGIEWVYESEPVRKQNPLQWLKGNATVEDLINAILLPFPACRMTVKNGIIHIAQPTVAAHPNNFLNLRIERFRVEKEDLFEAENSLRQAIDLTLQPEDDKHGWDKGDSHPPPGGVFDTPDVNITGENLTVREILDRIALSNGIALWVIDLTAPEFMIAESLAELSSSELRQGRCPYCSWEFIPLKEDKDEKVFIELMIPDCWSAAEKIEVGRVNFYEGTGGGGGGGSAFSIETGEPVCGIGFSAIAVKGNDAIVNLRVNGRMGGGAEYSFEKKFHVPHDETVNYRFDYGIEVKAYIEPLEEDSGRR